jgi:hypothetical protein
MPATAIAARPAEPAPFRFTREMYYRLGELAACSPRPSQGFSVTWPMKATGSPWLTGGVATT